MRDRPTDDEELDDAVPQRRVRLDPPSLHAPRTDTIAAVSFGAALVGFGALSAVFPPLGIAGAGIGALSGIAALAYPWQRRRIHDLRLTLRIRRIQRNEPQPIATAGTGMVHVRGRVHVLREVPLLTVDRRIGAYVARRQARTRCTCSDRCSTYYEAIRTEWVAGRFAIVDDSGVAVIDGGVVDLWPSGRTLQMDGQLALRQGDVVDVLARAAPVEAPDTAALAPSTYRVRAPPLGLVGTQTEPVTIVLARSRSRGTGDTP